MIIAVKPSLIDIANLMPLFSTSLMAFPFLSVKRPICAIFSIMGFMARRHLDAHLLGVLEVLVDLVGHLLRDGRTLHAGRGEEVEVLVELLRLLIELAFRQRRPELLRA